ncbi:MAG: Coq4 family protein [Gammaproteobacteria bacterium]|nr:Coq4 family protein [Gammaproteobacteria bacterium]
MDVQAPSSASFQNAARRIDGTALLKAVKATRAGDEAGRTQLAAVMAWAGFSCPGAIETVYDNIAAAWLGSGESPPIPKDLPEAPLAPDFWNAFWSVIDDAKQGYDAASITARVAALGSAVHPSFEAIAESCARRHPGAGAALVRPVPGRTDLEGLRACNENSLGKTLYRMVVDQGYDLEVLDREAIGLNALPRSLKYLNTRILQMHDVWHLVAGYQTTASHEIAISAFQLAQFGHNYSAMFLATVTTISHVMQPAGVPVLLQLIAEAWQHGRRSPAFMDIDWESEWSDSIETIRARHGIPVYQSALPANLLETLQGD